MPKGSHLEVEVDVEGEESGVEESGAGGGLVAGKPVVAEGDVDGGPTCVNTNP